MKLIIDDLWSLISNHSVGDIVMALVCVILVLALLYLVFSFIDFIFSKQKKDNGVVSKKYIREGIDSLRGGKTPETYFLVIEMSNLNLTVGVVRDDYLALSENDNISLYYSKRLISGRISVEKIIV